MDLTAAQEFGRALKTIRRVRGWSGDHAARRAGISRAYLVQLEAGSRENPSDGVLEQIRSAYGIPDDLFASLLLRLRVFTALEQRGLGPTERAFVWRGVAQRLSELGRTTPLEPNEIVADVLRDAGEPPDPPALDASARQTAE